MSERLVCPKCDKGKLLLQRRPGGGTYWECGECKHRMDRLPSDLRFEAVLERDLWLRIFERDGLHAADAAALALRDRCYTPPSLDAAVTAERERWASRIRQSFVGIRRQETEMVEVTGQPLEGNTMHVHVHSKTKHKEKPMSTEQTFKRTCDGCGATQTWVDDGNAKVPDTLWYTVRVEFSQRRILGQRRGAESGAGIDACSAACVSKALAKIPVPEMRAEPATDDGVRPS